MERNLCNNPKIEQTKKCVLQEQKLSKNRNSNSHGVLKKKLITTPDATKLLFF